MSAAAWFLVIVISQSYGGDKVQFLPFAEQKACSFAQMEIAGILAKQRVSGEARCIPGTNWSIKERQ